MMTAEQERERCALIADKQARWAWGQMKGLPISDTRRWLYGEQWIAAKSIANAIRARGKRGAR